MTPSQGSLPRLTAAEVGMMCEFADHLLNWRGAKSVISEKDAASIWERHILDSLQLLDFAPGATRWLDIGSGAGFPSILIAIVMKSRPNAHVICVESDRRKCAFLSSAASRLQLNMSVIPHRVEDLRDPPAVDAVTIRALSRLEDLMTILPPYLKNGALAILPVGKQTPSPARLSADYVYEFRPSLTNPDSHIAIVRTKPEGL